MIRWKQATTGFPDYGMTFGNPDFVAYARAYGAKGIGSKPPTESRLCSNPRSRAGGVHLVVTPVDYSENKRVLVDELKANAVDKAEGVA